MKNVTLTIMTAAFMAFAAPVNYVHAADNTLGEKVDETTKDTGRAVKKGVRSAKDKGCEMINGKMDCAAKKLKHKAQNVGDKLEDAVD